MRFIRCHALVNLLSPVGAYLEGLHIYLGLVSAALIGLFGEAAPPPLKFTPAFWRGWLLLIEFILFHKVYSKHLGISAEN